MNKTYNIVWSQVRKCFVVVSEKAKRRGKASGLRLKNNLCLAAKCKSATISVLGGILSITALPAQATDLSLPSGSIFSIAGSQDTSVQTFSTSFTATSTGSNYILFAFREDPSYWRFGDVSITASGDSTNLFTDPTFTSGGVITANGYTVTAPQDWGVVYQDGVYPSAAGTYSSTPIGPSGGSWYDGAVGSFDGIYQGVNLIAGTTYNISFESIDYNSGSAPAHELGVFAGPCGDLSLAPSQCSPSGSGFDVLATPSQTTSAGGPSSTDITASGSPYQSSNLGTTVNPAFDGGTLQVSSSGTITQDFTISSNNGTIDQNANSSTFSGVISNLSTAGSLTIENTGTPAVGSVSLSGVNTYTGSTTINSGATLDLTGTGSIASSSGVNDNGTFSISGASGNETIKSLSGAGGVTLSSNSLLLSNAGGTFSGAISGAGGLNITGGTEILSGNNTYSGATTIGSGATLALSGSGSIAASSGVADSGTFDISGTTAGASIKTLSGGGVVNLGTKSLTLTNGNNDTFSGAINGSGGLIMNGGTETLSGVNTYTGGTTLNGGTLKVSADNNLGGSGALTFNGGTLENTASFTSARNIVLTGAANFNTDNGTTLIDTAGTISGSGSINKQGTGTLILGAIDSTGGVNVNAGNLTVDGASTYTGATTIAVGATLALSGSGSLANSSGVADNGTFDISSPNSNATIQSLSGTGGVTLGANNLILSNANGNFGGVISGAGGLTLSGGTETLSGANTYQGGTNLNGGTLQVSADNNLGNASGALNFNGGTLENTASFTSTRNIALTGAANFNTDNGTTLTDTAGTISGSGSINKQGTGTLILGSIDSTGGVNVNAGNLNVDGASTYTGATTIAGGATLALSGSGSIAASSGVADSGAFDISGTTAGASITSLSGSGGVTLGGKSLTLTNASDTYSGVVAGVGGSLTISGGTETLSGANTYTGLTTINGSGQIGEATLALTGTGSIASSSGVNLVGDGTYGGNFDISGTTAGATIASLTSTGGDNEVFLGNQTLTISNATGTFGGVISDGSSDNGLGNTGGSLTIAGGAQTLTGANTYTGLTTINNAATLALSGSGSIAASSGVADNGVFDISGTTAGASITTLSGGGVVNLGPESLTLTNGNNDTFSGAINGSGGLIMNGGTETLSGVNTYTGGTTFNGGTLKVSTDNNLGGSGALTFNGGTLENTASFTSARNIVLTGAANFNTDNGTTLIDTAGTISGSGSINKQGTGTLILGAIDSTGGVNVNAGNLTVDGASTYTGATTIAGGATLALSGSGSLANSSGVADNGTFDISSPNSNATIQSLSGTGGVTLGANNLILSNANGNFGGVISGAGGLTLSGGTETLSGANTYQGGTNLNGGTLQVSADNNLGNASGALNFNGGTLENTASFTSTRNIALTGAANFNTDNGTTLTDTAGTISGSGSINKQGTGTLILGSIDSTGGVNVNAGNLTVDGASTYTGATTIAGGATLALSGSGSIAASSGVADNGVFDISGTTAGVSITTLSGGGVVNLGPESLTLTNGNNDTFSGAINGSGGLIMNGGTETLSGVNTYTGGTTLNGGTLKVSADNNLGGSGALTFNGGTLENIASFTSTRNIALTGAANFNTDNGTTLIDTAGTISGSGSINKQGTGTLILGAIDSTGGVNVNAGNLTVDGASTYTGATTIAGGATLALSGSGSLANSSGVADNGTFDISSPNSNATIQSLSGTGGVTLGANNLILSNANGNFGGVISGAGGLTLSGGTETLSGANTYQGGTNLNGGTLQVSADNNLGNASGALNFNGGTLENTASFITGRNIAMTGPANFNTDGGTTLTDTTGSISGTGPINKLGGGNLVLGVDGSTGGINVNAGQLTLTGVSTDPGATSISNGATLALTGNGSIASSSGVADNGTFNISGANNNETIQSLTGTGGVTLGNNSLILSNASGAFSGDIAGNGGVSVTGGSETLSGVNAYTGGTSIGNGATLALSGNGSIAASSGVADNGTFSISGANNNETIQSLSGTGGVTLGNNSLLLSNANGNFGGVISGAGGLTLSGGTETLSGANTYQGGTNLNGGTLQVSADNNLGNASGALNFNGGTLENTASFITGRNIAMTGPANFNTDGGTTLTDTTGTISGTGPINKLGGGNLVLGVDGSTGGINVNAGQLTLTGVSTDPGATSISNGATLALTGNGSIASSSGVADNGTFNISGANNNETIQSLTGTGGVTLGNNSLILSNASGAFSGDIAGNGGVSVTGGSETLSGVNAYTGGTSIGNGATLALSGNGSIAASSGVADNGTFSISGANNNETIQSLSGTGGVTLGNNSLLLSNANGNFGGVISGAGGLTLSGGTETLSGANTYQGGTNLNGGTLQVSADNNLGNASGALNFNGGTLENTASFITGRNIAMTGPANFNTDGGTTLTDTTGTISGTGPINKLGGGNLVLGVDGSTGGINVNAGQLTLTGVSTDPGATSISNGATLALTGNGSIASSSGVADNGTFNISGANNNETIQSLTGTGGVTLGNNSLILSNASGAFSGDIAGNGGVSVTGGSETLSGVNAYTGGTSIGNGATLALSGNGSIAASSGVADNGTFSISGANNNETIQSLSGTGGVTLGNNSLLLSNANGSFGGVIGGAGGLNVTGGSETLTGVNTYTGGTGISNGATLALSGNGAITSSSGVVDNGTFSISGANGNETIQSLSGTGNTTLGNNSLILNNASGNYAGVIAGTGGVSVTSGTETLTGANTYSGGTGINNGATLALTGNGAITNSSGVADNGTFSISGANGDETIKSLSGSGSATLGNNNLILSNANGSFSGGIAGSGGLNVASGNETLSGVNTYSGVTAIGNGATLALTGNGAIAGSSAVVNNGTFNISNAGGNASIQSLSGDGGVTLGNNTLVLSNASGTFGGVIAGNGGLSVTGGTETLSGANTYTGDTNVSNGATLLLSGGGSLAGGLVNNSAVTVAQGDIFNVNGNYTQTANGVLNIGAQNDPNYGKLQVAGTANLASDAKINVNVNSINSLFFGETLHGVLQAQTLNSDGSFAVTDNSYLFNFNGVKDGNAVDLYISSANPSGVLSAAIAQNNTAGTGAASVLDQAVAGHNNTPDMVNVVSSLGHMSSQQQVNNAVSQVLPTLSGDQTEQTLNRLRGVNRIIQARLDENRGLSTGNGFLGNGNVWMKPFGSWTSQDNRGGVAGYSASTAGVAVGIDTLVNQNTRLGVSYVYSNSNSDSNNTNAPQNGNVNSYQAIGYGSYSLDERTDINFQGDFGYHNNKDTRSIQFMNRTASSNSDSWSGHAGVGIGRIYPVASKTTVTPSIRADYTHMSNNSYQESGAGALDLNVKSSTSDELIFAVDAKVNHAVTDHITLTANAGGGYDALAGPNSTVSAFAGSYNATFTTVGITPSPLLARGGAGVVGTTDEGLEITARYDFEERDSFSNQTVSVKVRMPF